MAISRWLAVAAVAGLTMTAQAAALKSIARNPYIGAIVTDADGGKVLVEVNADAPGWPASVCKLMTLMVVLDHLDKGTLHLNDMVHVTKEAARVGGSQVWLKENEEFTVDDMLYALMVKSANDVATALAIHVAGSKEAFVALMNQRAAALGMTHTRFSSEHGLPPSAGQQPDVSTARDLALLSLSLVKRPEVLRYTSTRVKDFRGGVTELRTHNHLLGFVDGVDGLKTGWWEEAGYSMAITAKRAGRRVIVVILGSANRLARDKAAKELLARGFASLPPLPPPPPVAAATNAIAVSNAPASMAPAAPVSAGQRSNWKPMAITVVVVLAIGIAIGMLLRRRTE